MPQFQIHDSDTGLKLLVEGPEEPSSDEAEQLIRQELQFLRTNLYHGAGNKFMLDVGPLYNLRRGLDESSGVMDDFSTVQESLKRELQAIKTAKSKVKAIIESGGDIGEGGGAELFQNIYQQELEKSPPVVNVKSATPTERTGLQLSPNTLLILAHGAQTGGLSTEGGQDFTLHNLAQILGSKSNVIHNIINTACYGGKCRPEDFQVVFPNVTNVRSADFSMPNTISINGLAGGQYFATNTVPGIWKRYGTNWVDSINGE